MVNLGEERRKRFELKVSKCSLPFFVPDSGHSRPQDAHALLEEVACQLTRPTPLNKWKEGEGLEASRRGGSKPQPCHILFCITLGKATYPFWVSISTFFFSRFFVSPLFIFFNFLCFIFYNWERSYLPHTVRKS